jgi:hypothetical protein
MRQPFGLIERLFALRVSTATFLALAFLGIDHHNLLATEASPSLFGRIQTEAQTPPLALPSVTQAREWFLKPNLTQASRFEHQEDFMRKALHMDRFSNAIPKCYLANSSFKLVTVSQEDVPVLIAPAVRAEPVAAPDRSPRRLDPRYDLKILEEKTDWVRVAVVSPQWPPGNSGWSGWIERKNIQRVETNDERRCLFVNVLEWKGLATDKLTAMRDVALIILHDDPRCNRIARGDFLAGGQRIYFTCYPTDGGRPYHYWLSPLTQDTRFNLPPLLARRLLRLRSGDDDESVVMNLCQTELEKVFRNIAIINGSTPQARAIFGIQLLEAELAYYLTLDYRVAGEEKKAYCFIPRGGGPEITLTD